MYRGTRNRRPLRGGLTASQDDCAGLKMTAQRAVIFHTCGLRRILPRGRKGQGEAALGCVERRKMILKLHGETGIARLLT